MEKKISASARDELVRAVAERYRAATRAEKLAILDEFVAVTGYHRKHAIRMLNSAAVAAEPRRRRLPVYDEAVRLALVTGECQSSCRLLLMAYEADARASAPAMVS